VEVDTVLENQTTDLKKGQEVIAGNQAIGELIGTLVHEEVTYLHVRRYGAGEDDLYIPSIAVERIVPKHVYLNLDPETLLAQAWHQRPGA
jgi:hypothetical protein